MKSPYAICMLLVVSISLLGCQKNAILSSPSPTSSAAQIPENTGTYTPTCVLTTISPATKTSAKSYTPTIRPSSTPTKTSKPTHTTTPTITETPTYGPSPTVTSTPWERIYSQRNIIELFNTNGNCRLPCWWGIIPGTTTTDQMRARFAPHITSGVVYIEPRGNNSLQLYFPAPSSSILYSIRSSVWFTNAGTIIIIGVWYETMMYGGFNPTYLLNNYGVPESVWLAPGQMILYYEKYHFFADYAISENERTKQACFAAYNCLYTWAPEVNWTISNVKNKLEIEELKEVDIQVFQQAFQTWKGLDNCFQYEP